MEGILRRLTQLERLSVGNTSVDAKWLPPQLETLSFDRGTHNVANAAALARLTRLQALSLPWGHLDADGAHTVLPASLRTLLARGLNLWALPAELPAQLACCATVYGDEEKGSEACTGLERLSKLPSLRVLHLCRGSLPTACCSVLAARARN
jgi:hypothetical protein